MIGSLRGKVLAVTEATALIEAGGVGYEVELPLPAAAQLRQDSEIFLYIHHAVREDAQVLYGFASEHQRTLFRLLIKINSVGPKLALAVLSAFDVPAFAQAVSTENLAALQCVSGVGKRTAERIMLDMKDKVRLFDTGALPPQAGVPVQGNAAVADAVSALSGLGYREQAAAAVVRSVYKPEMDTEAVIRAALAVLAKGHG